MKRWCIERGRGGRLGGGRLASDREGGMSRTGAAVSSTQAAHQTTFQLVCEVVATVALVSLIVTLVVVLASAMRASDRQPSLTVNDRPTPLVAVRSSAHVH